MDPTEDVHRLQDELIKAVESYAMTLQASAMTALGR
jgi:hypothetical protein